MSQRQNLSTRRRSVGPHRAHISTLNCRKLWTCVNSSGIGRSFCLKSSRYINSSFKEVERWTGKGTPKSIWRAEWRDDKMAAGTCAGQKRKRGAIEVMTRGNKYIWGQPEERTLIKKLKRGREQGLIVREWGGGAHNNSRNPTEIILQQGPSSLTTRLWLCRAQPTSDYFSTLHILLLRDRIRAERTALIGLLPCRISSALQTEKWGRGYIMLYVDL